MRKIIYRGLFLALIGVAFASCEKDEINIPENLKSIDDYQDSNDYSKLKVNSEGVLEFSSLEYYMSFIEVEDFSITDNLISHVNKMNFNSYGKTNPNKKQFDSKFIESILDENQIVKIGEWYIKIDPANEKVIVVSDKEQKAYEGVKNDNHRAAKIFSIGDDVIDHLMKNTLPSVNKGCGGIGGSSFVTSKYYTSPGTWYRCNMKFIRLGIFFVLKGGFNSNDIAGSSVTKTLEIKGPEAWCKRRSCGSNTIKKWNSGDNNYTNVYKYDLKFYQNVRNLNGYYFFVRLKVEGIITPWVGRNINSPH